MSHASARLSAYGRNLVAQRVLSGHKTGEVAKQAGVSRQTVYKWVQRFHTEGWRVWRIVHRVRTAARPRPTRR